MAKKIIGDQKKVRGRKGAGYDFRKIEKKWNAFWREKKIYHVDVKRARRPFYNLMMFPYPSAEGLHIGNVYAFTGADIYGRFKRMQGYDVFQPIGLDGFGIHTENYALKIGEHPAKLIKRSEKRFYRQLASIGNAFSWDYRLETYKPDYYRWTQWIFIQLFKAGLVEKRKSSVYWCPTCKTTLADEQVIDGKCERCGTPVERRELDQWFFKITKYADRLLKNLDWINWSERTKIAQRNWIGKSVGAKIKFRIANLGDSLEVFTTRPDTLWGATFMVIAPEHNLVKEIRKKAKLSAVKIQEIEAYVSRARRKSELERTELEKEKTGVFSGLYALNPATGKQIPIWISDFVLASYGTGAIMAVPAHDERDHAFAKKYGLPIIPVIQPKQRWDFAKAAYTDVGHGQMINSGPLNGLKPNVAIKKAIAWLEKKGIGKEAVSYHLRDWCISRQRYWGPPIPMVYCPRCGWQPVKEEDLPVKLPPISKDKLEHRNGSPLAQLSQWRQTTCPVCGGPAEREVDVSDTFLDSCWYFFRYPSVKVKNKIFDPKITKKWLPVDMYIGGQEHACLHLMYARFITMVFKDLGLIDFEEPFKRFFAHGLIIKDGMKMSKSRGNVVVPDEYLKKYGVDVIRCFLMFMGPFDKGGDFRDSGIKGIEKFLARVRALVEQQLGQTSAPWLPEQQAQELKRKLNQLVAQVTAKMDNLEYNTILALLMSYTNDLKIVSDKYRLGRELYLPLLQLLAPFAPYLTEELWHRLGEKGSIHRSAWPKVERRYLQNEKKTLAVQVNGKLRATLELTAAEAKDQEKVVALAKKDPRVAKYLAAGQLKKTIFVPGKIVNFVVK